MYHDISYTAAAGYSVVDGGEGVSQSPLLSSVKLSSTRFPGRHLIAYRLFPSFFRLHHISRTFGPVPEYSPYRLPLYDEPSSPSYFLWSEHAWHDDAVSPVCSRPIPFPFFSFPRATLPLVVRSVHTHTRGARSFHPRVCRTHGSLPPALVFELSMCLFVSLCDLLQVHRE